MAANSDSPRSTTTAAEPESSTRAADTSDTESTSPTTFWLFLGIIIVVAIVAGVLFT